MMRFGPAAFVEIASPDKSAWSAAASEGSCDVGGGVSSRDDAWFAGGVVSPSNGLMFSGFTTPLRRFRS